MNDVSIPGVTALQQDLSAGAMILDSAHMKAITEFADAMARSVIAVPQHFRGKPADCLAVCMQAVGWGMNPFAVAQKTHVTQGGALGYEGQLLNAVIINRGPIEHRPEFEFFGDWSKILGKVAERVSDKGGKYYVATWDKKDEEGLGVKCSAKLKGEATPRTITVMMTQAYPRFSTQWATDPMQQITYLAVRKLARRYFPDVILGVYDLDEAMQMGGPIIDVGGGSTEAAAMPPAPTTAKESLRRAATKGKTAEPDPDPRPDLLPDILARISGAGNELELELLGPVCKKLKGDAYDTAKQAYADRLRALRADVPKTPAPRPPADFLPADPPPREEHEPVTVDMSTGEISME